MFSGNLSHFINKKVCKNKLIILATALLVENSLLVSRYTRFQHLSPKTNELFEIIRSRQKALHEEYLDTAERCERLIKAHAERLNPGKDIGNKHDNSNFAFELADLAIYLRWFIMHNHSQKDFNTFYTRMKVKLKFDVR